MTLTEQNQAWFDMLPALPDFDNVKAIDFDIFKDIVEYAYKSGLRDGLQEAKQIVFNHTSQLVEL